MVVLIWIDGQGNGNTKMRKRFHIRISDNVLEPEDWPIAVIYIRGHLNTIASIDTSVKSGCYSFPSMLGWNLTQLFNWLKYDATGQHPETYHEIGLYDYKEKKFYPCGYNMKIETIDSNWCICSKCNETTIHDNNDLCCNLQHHKWV